MEKRLISIFLTVVMLFSATVPALAVEENLTDIIEPAETAAGSEKFENQFSEGEISQAKQENNSGNEVYLESDTAFIDNPHWQEVTADTVTQKYSNRDSFVVVFFRQTCFNSNLRKTMISDWMINYGFDIYGVDNDQYGIPNWVWSVLPSQRLLPIICIVENGTVSAFTANDSMRSIQKRLQEYLGIYDKEEIGFASLNTEIYGNYSLRASTAISQHCLEPQNIPSEVWTEAQSIVQGLSGDREKLKAIYDWVTTNIYYDYGMLNETDPRKTSARETYINKSSVCSGYANLTKALCNAVGIPCRVVTGFAAGVDTESTVGDVWQIYKTYIDNQNFDRFAADIAQYENHAWNEAYIDGKWVILDTTWGSNNEHYPGQGKITGTPTDMYFDPNLDWFSESHLFWIDYSCDLSITADSNQISVSGILDNNDIAAARYYFWASYDADGRLLDCTKVTPSGTTFVQSLTNHKNAAEIKMFLLNAQYAPAALPLYGKIK